MGVALAHAKDVKTARAQANQSSKLVKITIN